MRIARFSTGDATLFGVIDGQPDREEITAINGDPFLDGINLTNKTYNLAARHAKPRFPSGPGELRPAPEDPFAETLFSAAVRDDSACSESCTVPAFGNRRERKFRRHLLMTVGSP